MRIKPASITLTLLPCLHSTNAFIPVSTNLKANHVQNRQSSSSSAVISLPIRRSRTHLHQITNKTTELFEPAPTPETIWQKLATAIVDIMTHSDGMSYFISVDRERIKYQVVTLLRVGIPSVLIGIAAFLIFPGLSLWMASIISDERVFSVLSQDSSQYVQNALTVVGLLFSILVGQTYYFLYQQQESVYYALFNEVTEAKSLLEQVALVCQGRGMYGQVLESISRYVQNDLKQLSSDPAVLLSSRPIDDPLESIMYMTSVGVPSTVYETVRSLRQARSQRLGALQRKLPKIHMLLLWFLAAMELMSFPLLGAGTQAIGGYNILTVEGVLFGVLATGIVMTLRVVTELYRPAGGAYNVDTVLSVMVGGMEEELKMRMKGQLYRSQGMNPSSETAMSMGGPPLTVEMLGLKNNTDTSVDAVGSSPIKKGRRFASPALRQQGGMNGRIILKPFQKVLKWVGRRLVED